MFHATISKKVMMVTRKHVKMGSTCICDTELIHSRVMCMMNSHDIDLKAVVSHELAPVPTSIFDEMGEMQITTTKATLKNKLKIEMSARTVQQADVTIIDGCVVLWVIHWPSQGIVQNYVDGFLCYIEQKLCHGDIFLVFDCYYNYSIKNGTRISRVGRQASRYHKLTADTPLPPPQVVFTVASNKVQLISISANNLLRRWRCFSLLQTRGLSIAWYLLLLNKLQNNERFKLQGLDGQD